LLGRAFLGKDGWETHIQYVPRMEYVHDYCKHEIDEIIENEHLSDDDKHAVLRRNAERFYGLKPLG
jgi:hypothetical protein